MKNKFFNFCAAIVSLLIGFVIVLSLSPEQKTEPSGGDSVGEPFIFKNDAEVDIPCVYGSGRYAIHFTAYQRPEVRRPDVNYRQAFCEKLPGPGLTLIALDLMDREIRDKPVVLKLLRRSEGGSAGSADEQVLSESSYHSLPKGLVQHRVELEAPGFYTLVVDIGESVLSDDNIVKIPFEVGADL